MQVGSDIFGTVLQYVTIVQLQGVKPGTAFGVMNFSLSDKHNYTILL